MIKNLKSRRQRINDECLETITVDGKTFSDYDVAVYVAEHMRMRDFFNPVALTRATLLAFDVFLGEAIITSPKENWKFFDKDTKFEWK